MAIRHLPFAVGHRVRESATARFWRKALLFGVLALVLYLAMDLIAAWRYAGYSYRDQTISELSAVDAPTRTFWLILVLPYEGLMLGLAAAILVAAKGRRRLLMIGALLLAYGVTGLLWPFAPMHQREVLAAGGDTWTDGAHLVLAGVTSTLFLLMMVIGLGTFGKGFRRYTLATIAALAIFGTLTSLGSGGVAENDSTPWLGVWERVAVFGSMAWIAVLGVLLYRREVREGGTE
ncbi:MAG: DUF998 domain-containing protein [Dehalococcoidia bacterium]